MPPNDRVLSVSQLTSQVKQHLESAFPSVWVSGEASNVTKPHSGHIYFTLKDQQAQIKAIIWRSTAERMRFDLRDGEEVVVRGNLDVYAPRGNYQLIARQVDPLGEGALQLAFRQLQERLAAEGMFDPAKKKTLPRFPRKIAVVTSPSGAAIRDFLEVLRRRWRGVDVLVVPARVQGQGAAQEIAAAIGIANRCSATSKTPIDLLVVCRGGGSLEDLWSFNEEAVVRAIVASDLPVISAVGHEIDVTLSDLAADVRALTPSEAAELAAPSQEDIAAMLLGYEQRLKGVMRRRVDDLKRRLESLASRRVLSQPQERIALLQRTCDELQIRASRAMQRQLAEAKRSAESLAGRLETLSPLSVLARGYSVTKKADTGEVLNSPDRLTPGEEIVTMFASGSARSRIEKVESSHGQKEK